MGDLELTVLFAVGRHVNRRLKRPPPSFLFAPATVETKATGAPLALVNLWDSGATIFWKRELLRRLCHLQPLKCVLVIDMTNDFLCYKQYVVGGKLLQSREWLLRLFQDLVETRIFAEIVEDRLVL